MNATQKRILADLESATADYDHADDASVFDLYGLTGQAARQKNAGDTVARARDILDTAGVRCFDALDVSTALDGLRDAFDSECQEQVFDALYDLDLIVHALAEAGFKDRAESVTESAVSLAKEKAPHGASLREIATVYIDRLGSEGGVAPVWSVIRGE
jgi:hypothetical protein